MIGIYRGLVDEALTLARSPGGDLWIVESGTRGPFADASRIPGDHRNAVARLAGVAAVGSLTFQSVATVHRGQTLRLYVVGYELGRLGEPGRLAAGRPITRSHYEMLADRRARLEIGERLRLGRDVYEVVGLTDGIVTSGGDPVVHLTLRGFRQLSRQLDRNGGMNVEGHLSARSDRCTARTARRPQPPNVRTGPRTAIGGSAAGSAGASSMSAQARC